MNGRFNNVIEYLKQKKTSHFTGSTKLSFESGGLVGINEANKHDLPVTVAEKETTVDELLEMTKDPIFNGAIVLVYEEGNIIQYAYSKSYKGETLKKFLGM